MIIRKQSLLSGARRSIGLGIILIVTFVLYRIVTTAFVIRTVEVIGSGVEVSLDESKLTKNLLLFPAQKIRERLLHDNPLLRDVVIRKKYPHTLVIEPVKRSATALLVTGDQSVLLDSEGVVLPQSEIREPLPTIIINIGTVHIGQSVTDYGIAVSLRLLQKLGDSWYISLITKHEGGLLVAKYRETEIFFTQEANPAALIATLQTLLTGFRIKGSLPKVIDLRFDKPIVTF
ncbi:FtsQ-type POTRA domain-containing protein [Candidatus Gottesmanbacteria bacterium]|nr:FtsQ-type POTRA domain-containing protein [Candidatus Gottesmanbacteria bacterium]